MSVKEAVTKPEQVSLGNTNGQAARVSDDLSSLL